jgi:2-polyprenyl-6-hydroxyphenyl methylase/3-demethylubiquinone-9 3-methyltransferase
LAAAQLGARTIRSFDYDTRSAACTQELKRRYFPGLDSWSICRGDLLDERFVASLGRWDIVYCWGVAHHTGDMWRALELLADTVRPHGLLYVALYNDQQWLSRVWLSVKKTYCSGRLGRWLITVLFVPALVAMGLLSDILNRRNPILRYRRERDRGMSAVRDWFDWLGGYPFEVSKPEEVFRFFDKLGFQLVNLRTVGGGLGCNEFLFSREQPQPCTLGREEPT